MQGIDLCPAASSILVWPPSSGPSSTTRRPSSGPKHSSADSRVVVGRKCSSLQCKLRRERYVPTDNRVNRVLQRGSGRYVYIKSARRGRILTPQPFLQPRKRHRQINNSAVRGATCKLRGWFAARNTWDTGWPCLFGYLVRIMILNERRVRTLPASTLFAPDS
jgi:hypothetical protein